MSGSLLAIIRRAHSCAWALGVDIDDLQATTITRLVPDERHNSDFRRPPEHLQEYEQVLGGEFASGPAFEFPERMPPSEGAVLIEEVQLLQATFNGWTENEPPDRLPIMAIVDNGAPISICFCARKSDSAAEAGVETVKEYRGRGLAGLATAAWAKAVPGDRSHSHLLLLVEQRPFSGRVA